MENMNKIVIVVVGLFVSITLVAVMLVPIINDASTEDAKSENYYTFKMSELGSESMTLSYDSTDKALIDGVHPQVTSTAGAAQTNLYVVTNNSVIVTYGNEWYYYFVDVNDTYHAFNVSGAALAATTAVFENGTATISTNGVTYEFSYDWAYYPDPNGTYSYTRPTNGVFVNSDDTVISFNGGASSNGVSVGNYSGLTTTYHATSSTIDTDSFTASITSANAEKGVSTIKEIVAADPYNLIVPLEYEYKVEASGGVYSLYQVIVPLVIMALLLSVVALMVRNRYE